MGPLHLAVVQSPNKMHIFRPNWERIYFALAVDFPCSLNCESLNLLSDFFFGLCNSFPKF